jgi:hypothetical protein
MSQVGSLAANPHEGSQSEYLAQYVFSSFGTQSRSRTRKTRASISIALSLSET